MRYRGKESNTSRIAGLIRQEILSGRLHPCDKLESFRTLAKRFSVSTQVLVSVFRILAEEGLVVSRPKSGLFVAEKLPGPVRKKRLAIGFLNWKKPLNEAFNLRCFCTLIQQAGKQDIQILLNSGEQEIPLEEWYDQCRPDALIVTGRVDDLLVTDLQKLNIPFMILGNYRLAQKVNALETGLTFDVRTKLLQLMKKRSFRSLYAIQSQGIEGSHAVRKGFLQAAEKRGIPAENCIFYESPDNDGRKAISELYGKHTIDHHDLVFLNPDFFSGAARYFFEQKIREEERPFLLLDMPSSGFLPYPELVGDYLYASNDPLAENALGYMLDIYYQRVEQPKKMIVYGCRSSRSAV